MSDFLIEHAGPVLQELHKIATIHANASGGRLVALDYDPETYLKRDIMRHTIKGEPIDPININEMASGVDSRYKGLYLATSDCVEVDVIEDVLRSGQSVVFAMDHDELIDAALRPLALANIIKQRNPNLVDKNGRPFFRTALIVSRMAEFIGVPMMGGVVPANDLFGMAFDLTHETVPSTISTKGKFDKQIVKAYNNFVVREITSNTTRGAFSNRRPILLALAAPGTINKPLDADKYTGTDIPKEKQNSTMVIGQINYRMAEFAKNALTFASVAQMKKNSSDVRIDGTPICVSSAADVERLAKKFIELTYRHNDEALNYVYDKDGNLPVVRSLN